VVRLFEKPIISMKKLNLASNAIQRGEVLTRSQLKSIIGGSNRWIGSYGASCDEMEKSNCIHCCESNPSGIPDVYQCVEACKRLN